MGSCKRSTWDKSRCIWKYLDVIIHLYGFKIHGSISHEIETNIKKKLDDLVTIVSVLGIDISIVYENNDLLDFNNCDWSISTCLSIHRTNNISNNVDLIKFFSILKESKTELNQKPDKNSLDQELDFLVN